MTQPLRIGTRGSRLALWQANHVADLLRPLIAPRPVELVEIRTAGDRLHTASLTKIGGQGVFTKEIQQAVADGRADVAVHSLKDLPTQSAPRVVLAAVPPRASTSDVFVSIRYRRFDDLPRAARLATGSARRRAQVLYRRADLLVEDLRGNVDTRLRKLSELDLDGILLAQAGLERLELADRITEVLDAWMLPAVGQGALGLEVRDDDEAALQIVRQLNHPPSWQAVHAERAFLRELGGGCSLPIAARAVVQHDTLALTGAIFHPDGQGRIGGEISGGADDADQLGRQLARRLLAEGGAELLRRGMLAKIISGGQTGVDRAALDVALDLGIPCGGWCPAGRKAEDGPLPARYPLTETPTDRYAQRTRWNIRDSDGTLVFVRGPATGGTALTIRLAERHKKPCLVVDLEPPPDAVAIHHWMEQNRITTLNVAGPRESEAPGIYEQAAGVMRQFLSMVGSA